MPSVHHSLFARFSATAAPIIPEVVVNTDADDDNASTAPSNVSSTASLFAGGSREIDVFLRSAKAAIDANMAYWYERRRAYGSANQTDIEKRKDEEEISRAEDIDQLRVTIGHGITTWVMHATKNLDCNEVNDRQIRHRIAKYVDRQRDKLGEFGFLMERDASPEMVQWCVLPTADIIKEKVEALRTSTPVDDPLGKQIDAADNNPQDALFLGSEAANLHPTIPVLPLMPGMGRRSTSPHAFSAAQALAQQWEEERKEQEAIVMKQKQQMEEMKKKIDAETRRKEMQQQKAQKNAQAQAQAQAFSDNERKQKEDTQVRELQQQLALSRKQFEEMRSENEKMLESMRDSLQQQIIDSEHNDDLRPILNDNLKQKKPSKKLPPTKGISQPLRAGS